MSDREELADAIMSTHRVERHPELRRANSLIEADGILASSWLARHDAEVVEKALESAGWEYAVKDYRAPGFILLGEDSLDAADRVKYYGTRPLIRRRKAGEWEAAEPEGTKP